MKPLRGAEVGLADNLRSFFQQQYPQFEILLAVPAEEDGAHAIAQKVMAEFPQIDSRLIVTGETPRPNGKVHALATLLPFARHSLLVMSDSDVRAPLDLLQTLQTETTNADVVFCSYRASGHSYWTGLEALGMNTEFTAGVFTARLLGDLDFALGPTLAMRRELLDEMGGFPLLQNFLAEDFVIGNRAAQMGRTVKLSRAVIEHRLGAQPFRENMAHRLRWARSTRRSRPMGYFGLIFTNPLPLALIFIAAAPHWWIALPLTLIFRAAVAWATAVWAMDDPLTRRLWPLLPLQDMLSFFGWLGGFFGSTIHWRGRALKVLRDGRFEMP
jgi:ceramide glucosyltransferase